MSIIKFELLKKNKNNMETHSKIKFTTKNRNECRTLQRKITLPLQRIPAKVAQNDYVDGSHIKK